MNKQEYVASLRELADFVESREFPDDWSGWYGINSYTAPDIQFSVNSKTDFAKIAKAFGSFKKSGDSASTDCNKELSLGARLALWGKKEAICEKVVVGKRIIPAEPEQIIPATEEHEEEIIEWKCPESFIAASK